MKLKCCLASLTFALGLSLTGAARAQAPIRWKRAGEFALKRSTAQKPQVIAVYEDGPAKRYSRVKLVFKGRSIRKLSLLRFAVGARLINKGAAAIGGDRTVQVAIDGGRALPITRVEFVCDFSVDPDGPPQKVELFLGSTPRAITPGGKVGGLKPRTPLTRPKLSWTRIGAFPLKIMTNNQPESISLEPSKRLKYTRARFVFKGVPAPNVRMRSASFKSGNRLITVMRQDFTVDEEHYEMAIDGGRAVLVEEVRYAVDFIRNPSPKCKVELFLGGFQRPKTERLVAPKPPQREALKTKWRSMGRFAIKADATPGKPQKIAVYLDGKDQSFRRIKIVFKGRGIKGLSLLRLRVRPKGATRDQAVNLRLKPGETFEAPILRNQMIWVSSVELAAVVKPGGGQSFELFLGR